MKRSLVRGAALCAALLGSASASAQSDLLVRYYANPGYGGEGEMPYRDCTLGTSGPAEDAAEDEYSDAPLQRQEATLPSGLTIERAEELRAEKHVQLEALIVQLDQLLASMPPDYPARADVLFRKADALKQLADADYLVARATFTECIDNWYSCASDSECYEPMPDYTVAIDAFRTIARSHPSYERLDEVIFRLGETLMENDSASDGIQFLTRLVNTYPDSQYLPDARLLMAEHYFDNNLLIAARQNYDEVLRFPSSSVYNYALYKLAWVDINEYQFEEALTRFQTVVRNLDAMADPQLDFRRQSLNDMLKAYVELDDGWLRARDYYEGYGGEELMRRQLTRLATMYDEQFKQEERVAILEFFFNRFPSDSMIPQWAADIRDSLEKIGNWDRMEERTRYFISYMAENGPWWIQNSSDARAQTNAKGYSHDWLLHIINRNYTEAERLRRNQPAVARALFEECAADYAQFFAQFPESPETYNQAFLYAELLYYKLVHDSDETFPGCSTNYAGQARCDEWLAEAGDAYKRVVELDPRPEAENAHDAAVGALQVYDDFMKRVVPDIDDPLPPPNQMVTQSETWLARYGATLTEAEQNYVDIVEWFAQLYPDDDLIPPASWRAAGLYLRHGMIGEAGARFETIIEHHPRHRFAQQAALGAFVCYNHEENWVKIESVARRLLTVCDEIRGEDACDPDRLTQAIAYAMNNQAEDLMTAGNALRDSGDTRGARTQYVAAAEKRVALYREFPDSEWSSTALFNAAATYEAARNIDESINLYTEFITRYPTSEQVPDAMFVLGLIQDSQARFAIAADWFERLDSEHPESADREDAVLNAARLREALGEMDRAIALYDHFLSIAPTATVANDVYFVVAEIESDRGNLDGAFARYQQFLDRVSNDSIRRLIAVHRQARLREQQGRASDALALYGQVYTLYGRGEMGFDAQNLPTGWITQPGGNFSESERTGVLPYAAEARYKMAGPAIAQAAGLPLGNLRRIQDEIQARFAAMAAAQRELYEVYNMGDAEWAVAATSGIGETFYDFYKDLIGMEAPDFDECLSATGYNYDVCDSAMEAFDEAVFNVGEELRVRAETAWLEARSAAIENNVFNDQVLHTIALLNDLDRAYALGITSGFDARNTSDPYLSTGYILDLAQKLSDFANFVEAPAEPAGLMLETPPSSVEVE
ncbi:MAG: tetratricopeptide repeat protein [Myxococcales bacterium]|nr:tetratricopeptide repeat protein [Myxococcales bacterium]MCB9531047.1 tetratricopeptide repeat protein [Myxococcales bacterium]MCB9532957.1 tetratricopeptide repeat protein [Myxococcales bacterium]